MTFPSKNKSHITSGRLVPWAERDRADWIAHAVPQGVFLQAESRRAATYASRRPSAIELGAGWVFAEWWDSPLEEAVAREIADGWNVTFSTGSFNEVACGRMLAAILGGEGTHPLDVTDAEIDSALRIAKRSGGAMRHPTEITYLGLLVGTYWLRAADRAARVAAGVPLDQHVELDAHDYSLARSDLDEAKDQDEIRTELERLSREELLAHLVRAISGARLSLEEAMFTEPGLAEPPPRLWRDMYPTHDASSRPQTSNRVVADVAGAARRGRTLCRAAGGVGVSPAPSPPPGRSWPGWNVWRRGPSTSRRWPGCSRRP